MKVPVEWLNEYVNIKAPVEEVADFLTMAGLEVEEIDHLSVSEIVQAGGVPDGEDDRIMVTKVTPNRGDWLSMIGVAREVSAVTDWEFKMPSPEAEGTGPDASSLIKISIIDPDLCRRYVGIIVRNVTIKDSPNWMKNRLIRAGMRPINNIVDITNYVMLEMGQPLHAFDYDLLGGSEIIVRRARKGEKITTIDDIERTLYPDMLVIADSDKAVAVAGVMGGSYSEVTSTTKNILIESANFDPVSVRRTSKLLGLVTESSYRFERSVDPGITDVAAKRAAELMKDLADGEIAAGIVDIFPGKKEPLVLEVRPERVNWLLGTNISAQDIISYLHKLKFWGKLNNKAVSLVVPTFRPDVTREVDVIEEIARIFGYENIKATLPSGEFQGKDSKAGRFSERLREICMACGMQEVLTHSLTDSAGSEMAGLSEQAIAVRNPLSEEASHLRSMLAPNLLQAVARNQSVGIKDLSIFEIGKVYRWSPSRDIHESSSVAGVMTGSEWASAWNLSKEALIADFYLVKGALESLLDRLNVRNVVFKPALHPLLHPSRAAEVKVGDVRIGILGEASPDVIDRLDIRGRPCIFELDIDTLMPLVPEAAGYDPLPRFPALYRHIAVVISKETPYANIQKAIVEAGGVIVEAIELLDVYTGKQIGENEQSLTLSIVFRSKEKTLTDEEVSDVLDVIKSRLASSFDARFRA